VLPDSFSVLKLHGALSNECGNAFWIACANGYVDIAKAIYETEVKIRALTTDMFEVFDKEFGSTDVGVGFTADVSKRIILQEDCDSEEVHYDLKFIMIWV
jgi:hypothetical protein